MLGKYIKFDGVQFPNPVSGTFAPQLVPQENVYLTESGKQASNIVRLNRYCFDAQFNCTSSQVAKLEVLFKKAQCVCEIDGQEYTGRLRGAGSYTMVNNSELTEGTQGLWTVPVRFEGQ